MDAVILAGGRGSRVTELTPEFHKPLLRVNGTPLIVDAVHLALSVDVETAVVVVAPQNAQAIAEALKRIDRVMMIVQREPLGPAHALWLGLMVRSQRVQSYRVLVLLSDNVSTHSDVELVTRHETAVGIRAIDPGNAHRFTQLREPGVWVEKQPVADLTKPVPCWVGPFVGWRTNMEKALEEECVDASLENREALIGPHLSKFSRDGKNTVVNVSSYDVGTVESYLERM